MINEFENACSEIYAIFDFMPKEYYDKIPENLRELIAEKRNKDYQPNIDPYIYLNEQDLLMKTRVILSVSFREYWCTDEERKKLDKRLKFNDAVYQLGKYKEKTRSCSEALAVLELLSDESKDKIPDTFWSLLKQNEIPNMTVSYNPKLTFAEQDFTYETVDFLMYIKNCIWKIMKLRI